MEAGASLVTCDEKHHPAAMLLPLGTLWGIDYGLSGMARRVASGDLQNVEAQAARRYWMVVFGDAGFHRGDEEDSRNAVLNYGYAVLRRRRYGRYAPVDCIHRLGCTTTTSSTHSRWATM